MTFTAGFLLLMWVVASILGNGIALLHRLTKVRGLALIGYGAAAGVLFHALIGWGIAGVPAARWVLVGMLIILTLGSAVYFVLRGVLRELFSSLSAPAKISLGLWLLLLVLCLALLHVDLELPESLPDGLYISKAHTTNVKIQYLTSLPVDNFIPFAVAEFFLRGVSFKKHRPIIPGQEVSNRTILMSLVAIPFLAALDAPRDHPRLGTYKYIGQNWPDVWKLDEGNGFEEFAVVGMVLNSLMLVGLFIFCSSLGANSALPVGTLLYITDPYFITQTIYTWPKALAGFFILLAWTSIRLGHGPAVVAALMALAYHSHPYALVFAGCTGLYYVIQWRRGQSPLSAAVHYFLILALVLAPWIIWTKFVLQIPADLITQNFSGGGTEPAWTSPVNFVWIRLQNLFYLIGSQMFSIYPFDVRWFLNYILVCLPGIIGFVIIYPALAECIQLSTLGSWVWYGLVGPAALILVVFSRPALPALHGYQASLGVLLFLGAWWLRRHCTQLVYVSLIGLQIALNLSFVLARGISTGARLW
jgi:hypothetical protein